MKQDFVPVITIDGPSGVGKGTIAQMVAQELGWHFLDSGALYRAVAWAALHYQIDPQDEVALAKMLENLKIEMCVTDPNQPATIICEGENITQAIREPACSQMASKISAIPLVREALLQRQRDMQQAPGLVADGRDMGTVVFANAPVKFYFLADLAERAKRRYKQLKEQGISVSLPDIQQDLEVRDKRDAERKISPTKPADDAILIDTTHMGIDQVLGEVLVHVHARLKIN